MGDNVPPPSQNNFSLLSMLNREKLIGTNYLDWNQTLRIALRYEEKEFLLDNELLYLDEFSTEEENETYNRQDTESRKVACIMLASMTSKLQKGFDNIGAYDLNEQLREMFQQQAHQE